MKSEHNLFYRFYTRSFVDPVTTRRTSAMTTCDQKRIWHCRYSLRRRNTLSSAVTWQNTQWTENSVTCRGVIVTRYVIQLNFEARPRTISALWSRLSWSHSSDNVQLGVNHRWDKCSKYEIIRYIGACVCELRPRVGKGGFGEIRTFSAGFALESH